MPGLFGARRFPQIDPMVAAGVAQERPGFGGDFTPQPQPQRRRGLGTRLFGEGWEGKLSALGGLLMGDQNAVSDYHALRQQMDLKEAMRQRERTDDFEDWRRREEWERANPTPRVNDTVADYEFITGQLGPEWGEKFLRNRADPPRYVQGPDGQFYPVQTAEPPTRPVGRLTPIEGGPGGSPSGAGFRP